MLRPQVRARLAEVPLICGAMHAQKLSRLISRMYSHAMAPSGLRFHQFALLVTIFGKKDATIGSIADSLVMDRTTLSRNLRPLIRTGHVAVGRGADQRERVVRLTRQGLQALADGLPLWERASSNLRKVIGPKRTKRLVRDVADAVAAVNAQ